MSERIENIAEASAAVANLPSEAIAVLSGGREVAVRRLSWIKFEALWTELAGVLGTLLVEEGASVAELARQLGGAPAFVLKLASLASDLPEGELAKLRFDDVLALGAEALKLNFVDSAGVRGFFAVLGAAGELGPGGGPAGNAATP